MESKTVDASGIVMRWVERGEGVPVILVHGFPTSPALWRFVMPMIAGARAMAWEMVGYGDSIPQGRGRDISVARQAEYLRCWMDAVGIGRAVLVGHDLGGGVVQIAAVHDPSICAGLVLANSIGYDSWPVPSIKAMRAASGLISRLPAGTVKVVLSALFYRRHDNRTAAKESLDVYWKHYAKHDGPAALVRQLRALDNRDTVAVQDQLGKLRDLPARVVWGAADGVRTVRYGRRLARDLDCELVRIGHGKHFIPEDHPAELAVAIQAVVREVLAREPALRPPVPESAEELSAWP